MNTLIPAEVQKLRGDEIRLVLQRAAKSCRADEASLWLKLPDRDSLIMSVNCGARAGEMELRVEQPLSEGIVSKVFLQGVPVADDSSFSSRDHSKRVDISEGQATHYMTAVPLRHEGSVVGVVAAVQIATATRPFRKTSDWGLTPDSLDVLAEAAAVISRLLAL